LTRISTKNPASKSPRPTTAPRRVAYNPAVPIEAFDFIVTMNAIAPIYNLWRRSSNTSTPP